MNKSLQAVLDRAFPPSDFPTNGGLVIRDREIAFVLVKIAEGLDDLQCALEPECDVCNALVSVWWDWCMSLHQVARVRLQRVMRESSIPLPRAPWEEVPTNAVPTSRN